VVTRRQLIINDDTKHSQLCHLFYAAKWRHLQRCKWKRRRYVYSTSSVHALKTQRGKPQNLKKRFALYTFDKPTPAPRASTFTYLTFAAIFDGVCYYTSVSIIAHASLFYRRFLNGWSLDNSSAISPSGNCCLNCSQPRYAIFRVATDILEALDRNDLATLTLLDLSASFDTVDHVVLIHCLESSCGILTTVLQDWFKRYLGQRVQQVRFRGCLLLSQCCRAVFPRICPWTDPFPHLQC